MSELCSLCERRRRTGDQLCEFHATALRNLHDGYRAWSKAFGDLAEETYYSKLEKRPEIGHAVREVMSYTRRRQMFA